MGIKNNNRLPVTWLCSPYVVVLPELKNRQHDICFYKQCIFGPLILNIGDFVLISNLDAPEPDTVNGCDIAKIIYMYEEFGKDSAYVKNSEPFRAIVQWYSRLHNIPKYTLNQIDANLDYNLDIIEDNRFGKNISIETIFRKCSVIMAEVNEIPADKLSMVHKRNKSLTYICRYKLMRKSFRYYLTPVTASNDEESLDDGLTKSVQNETIHKTPKTRRASNAARSSVTETPNSDKKLVVRLLDIHKTPKIDKSNSGLVSKTPKLVSPIKIVGNTIQKLTRFNENEINTFLINEANGDSTDEANTVSPPKIGKYNDHESDLNNNSNRQQSKRKSLNVCRILDLNMNHNGDSTPDDSGILNYSIVTSGVTPNKDEMKLKLRISEKQNSRTNSVETDIQPVRRSTRRRSQAQQSFYQISERNETPQKQINKVLEETEETNRQMGTPQRSDMTTPSRRKSILKTPTYRLIADAHGTPKKSIQLSEIIEESDGIQKNNSQVQKTPRSARRRIADDTDEEDSPKHNKRKTILGLSRKSEIHTPVSKLKLIRDGTLTPTMESRDKSVNRRRSELQKARDSLHVSAVPKSLICRENEYRDISGFLEGKIIEQSGGCMYISGVPGTGKTATVTEVIRCLKLRSDTDDLPQFDFIEINGMRLTEPRQAYVQIYKQLTGKTVAWEQAHTLLEKRFTTPAPRRLPTVLLVDELDILCNRRQDVVYNLLDWPTKSAARLIVVTIANTMDLPERLLMGKVTSRLGLTRLTFQPYSHKQLQEIVTARLLGTDAFKSDAVQLVARKVAAVSGDARRALDICRRATEIAEEVNLDNKKSGIIVNMAHVQQALGEMIASAKVQAIKRCSKLEQLFLQAVTAEVSRTGVEETTFLGVYTQLETIAPFSGYPTPSPGRALQICTKLGSSRILICEHSRADIYQKILLNVSTDDVHYALQA